MKKKLFIVIISATLFAGCEKMLLGPEPENNAKDTFDVLWKSLDTKYPLFTIKNINWDSLYSVYSSQITVNTSEYQLWEISSALLSPLKDGHITLFGTDNNKRYSPGSTLRPIDFDLSIVKDKYISGSKTTGAGFITYGKIREKNIGYIHISTFGPSQNEENWPFDIDKVIQELYNCDAIVVDLRNNGGGWIVNVNTLVSVFIDREIQYFYSRQKIGPGHNDFGEPIVKKITPRDNVTRYNKKIALLTNRFSASGSEYFSQIFKNLDYATQIGDTTYGALGEVTESILLPNGWKLTYPCTFTTTPDGECFEGIGIPPDIYVENSKTNIEAGNDKVIEYAISYLSQAVTK